MTIGVGSRVGPYEVTALLGEGGMGKVWRARHTALKRDDALKVLPDGFASDPERLARFRREAQVLASLNHPNIAHVYGLEQSDDVQALVMELVEGPTLADRIAQGPIPLDEALLIAKQIAEALQAAHKQGIIHRDLKPANIKVRPDGTVKVLDFGLAKALEPVFGAGVDATASPTITSPAMSGIGVLLGTAAYMSPEQARGNPVDERSDIWAFGCVLYEMLTGLRAFGDEDISLTLSNVLRREPAFDALPSDTPGSVQQTLRLCLKKNPQGRLHAVGDVRLALAGDFDITAPSSVTPAPVAKVWQRPLFAASIVTLVAIASGLIVWTVTRPVPRGVRVARFAISTPGVERLAPAANDHDVAISPDGTFTVYRASNAGGTFLSVRAIGDLNARRLQGLNPQIYAPFISPDGTWVGFSDESDGTLKRVSMLGGPAVRICSTGAGAAGIAGASWAENDLIVFASNISGGLWSVPARGGDPQELTKPKGDERHAWPEVLPGGRAVLFTILSGEVENADIAVLDLATGEQRQLVPGGSYPKYSETGHIVYAIEGTLRAVPFDLTRMQITGPPAPLLDGVLTKDSGAADFALARGGTLVYVASSGAPTARRILTWVDRMGREEQLTAPERAYVQPRISPDGMRVALSVADQDNDIWMWELARHTLTRLTFDPSFDNDPLWTPDGRRVIFASQRSGVVNLYSQAADGTGTVERLTESRTSQVPQAITPDGTHLIWRDAPATSDLMLMALQPPRNSSPLFQTMFLERNAELSPDGQWLAYETGETGRAEVYVRPFPNVNAGRWQVSTAGGATPLWSRDGGELFFKSPDGTLMGTRVEPGAVWRSGTPQRVLSGEYHAEARRTFDISPDGRRFLMIKNTASGDSARPENQIVMIQNWHEELKRLVPAN